MNPSDVHSHLATLRQLKEMLDAGTLTPQEFEALKQKLVFGSEATAAAPPAEAAPIVPELPPPPEGLGPEMTVRTAETPEWLAASGPEPSTSIVPTSPAEADDDGRRNPLTLVFILGGALLLLALVLYLTLGSKSADEHLTSTSQTAADSTATAPEVGPQADQITLPPTAPETIRVAPAVPLKAAPAPAQFRPDSAAPAATPSAPAKAVPAVAPTKVAPPAPPAAVPDSTTKAGQS